MMLEPLRCTHHGWRAELREIVERLCLHTGRSASHYWKLLEEELGLASCSCGHHLIGSLTRAIEILSKIEVDELESLYSSSPADERGGSGLESR